MKFDYHYQESISDLHSVPSEFRLLEQQGFDGIWVREAEHDSFRPSRWAHCTPARSSWETAWQWRSPEVP